MKSRKMLFSAVSPFIVFLFIFPRFFYGEGTTWLGQGLAESLNSARGKLGPFKYQAAFQIGDLGYNSDIYSGQGTKKTPDYGFNAGPIVTLYLPITKKIVIDLYDAPRYVFFSRARSERTLNNAFRGQVHFSLNRFYIQVGGGLTDAKERLSTELNLNIRHTEDSFGGIVFWQIAEKSGLALQYRETDYAFENPQDDALSISENLDRNERYFKASAYVFQDSVKRVYVDAEIVSYGFRNSNLGIKDYRSYAVLGGIEFAPVAGGEAGRKGLHGILNLGYQRFEIPDMKGKIYEGLVGNTNLSAVISRFLTINGGYSRSVQFSAFINSGHFIQTATGGGLSIALKRHLSLSYNVMISQNEYIAEEGKEFLNALPRKYQTHALSLSQRLGPNSSLNLRADLSLWRASAVDPFHRRVIIGLGIMFGLPSGG